MSKKTITDLHLASTCFSRYLKNLNAVARQGDARDRLTIRWSEQEAWDTVRAFSGMDPELARQAYELGKDARDWKVTMAQKDLLNSGPTREKVVPILYRPFDVRHTYYTGRSRGFLCMPRPEVMQHMLAGENIVLNTCRQIVSETWQHCFVTNDITEKRPLRATRINRAQYFGPISPEIYAYRIGGYQVCDKWLKDRKERRLELNDIRTYCQVVTAIGITLEIQQELDILYNDTEKNLVTIPTE